MAGDQVASPGFEGFEKRLEIEFYPSAITLNNPTTERSFLRLLPLSALEEILTAAECTIVSGLSNTAMDSYVLSESSLFVYPLKIIIKTCGTTKLLNAIPPLLKHAGNLSLAVRRCRYSRGSFLFPAAQSYPHRNFAEEVSFLDCYFGNLGSGSKSYVLSQDWHIYSAVTTAEEKEQEKEEDVINYNTLEVCMTKLERSVAAKFFKEKGNETAGEMTLSSGILNILPDFEICDYAFDPCGYSMNAIEIGGAYSTIHITPEDHCSYASFEIMDTRNLDIQSLMYRIACTFRPGTLSFSLYRSADHAHEDPQAGISRAVEGFHLHGYECSESARQKLPGGGVLDFFSFEKFSSISEASC